MLLFFLLSCRLFLLVGILSCAVRGAFRHSHSETRWPNDPPSLVSNEAANATLTVEVPVLDSATKILILNKADTSKNALRAETLRDMTQLLRKWNRDTVTTSVVLRPNSLASLSAGIDFSIVRERDAVERVVDVIGAMGSLAHVLGSMGTASFVLAPGIVAGAGASLLHAGTCRAVAKQTKFSHPEVSFGFVPFGGASYWLAQLDELYVAAYVALTGAPLRAGDLVASGIATHELQNEAFAPQDRFSLGWAVASVYVANAERFVERAKRCEIDEPTQAALLERHGSALKSAFSHDSVPAIVDALKHVKGESKDWAQRSARLIEQHCPLATAAALRLLHELRAPGLSYADALRIEYRVASRLAAREHGLAGIEARLARRTEFRWPTSALDADALRSAVNALFASSPTDASDSRALAALDKEAAVVAWDARADLTRSSAIVMNSPMSTNMSVSEIRCNVTVKTKLLLLLLLLYVCVCVCVFFVSKLKMQHNF